MKTNNMCKFSMLIILLLFVFFNRKYKIIELFQVNNQIPYNNIELMKYSPPLPKIPGCIVRGDGRTYCHLNKINDTVDNSLRFILDKVNHLCGNNMFFECSK